MCQILGISSDKPYNANEILRSFYANSKVHKDGWGLALFNGPAVSVEKEPLQAIRSNYLTKRLASGITCRNLLAHIRLASVGEINYNNCHPFTAQDKSGRTWTLVHNGTIFEPDLITGYFRYQQGTTDSEAVLLFIIDTVNKAAEEKGRALTPEERFEAVDGAVCGLSKDNKLNLIIYDGEVMYVHTNLKETLFERFEEGTRIIATEPLTLEGWEPVKMNTLLAYKDGNLVLAGTDHGNEFIPEKHDMSLIYMSYSGL